LDAEESLGILCILNLCKLQSLTTFKILKNRLAPVPLLFWGRPRDIPIPASDHHVPIPARQAIITAYEVAVGAQHNHGFDDQHCVTRPGPNPKDPAILNRPWFNH
jgi:hypothetical protein